MSLLKFTAFRVISVERASGEVIREAEQITKDSPFIKAAHRAHFDYERRPGFIYVRSRAISSRTNDNYDEFPAAEIKKAWRTFIGKPVFVNHHNANHRRARGFIIDAALHEDTNPDGSPDTWAEVLMEIDAVRFPRLAEAVIRGDIARTSMGTDVQHSICTACGNRAETPADYCNHIPRMKGMKVRRYNAALGKQEEVLVAEVCYGLGFFENSLLVEEPADPTAYTLGDVEADWDTVPIQRAASRTAAEEGWISDRAKTDWAEYEVGFDDAQAGRKSVSQSKGYLLGFHHGLETKTAAYRDDPEVKAWYKTRENVTYTDGTRVAEGDHIRYHQAPGGLMSHGDWEYGVAAYLPKEWNDLAANELHLLTDNGRYLNLYGHVIERAEKTSAKISTLAGLQAATLLAEAEQITKDALGFGDVVDYLSGGRDPRVQCMECGATFRWSPERHRFVCPNGHATFPYNLHDEDWDRVMAHRALNEVKAPAQVDTLRADRCPVCKDDEGFNGEKCSVCGHVEPPEHFRDPDLSKAREMDLRQDVADEAGAVDPTIDPNAVPGDTSISGEMGTETGDQAMPDLQCTNCGEVFSAEGEPEADAEVADPTAQTDAKPDGIPEDPTRPKTDGPDDLDDLADKSDEDLGLDEEVDDEDEDKWPPEAGDAEKVDPAAEPAVTQKPGPPEFDKDPTKDPATDPAVDPAAKPDDKPLDETEDTGPEIGPNVTCPVCGVGTLKPMEAEPTAMTSQDLDDQQVAEPPRQRV